MSKLDEIRNRRCESGHFHLIISPEERADLLAVVDAALLRPCNRFDVTPCSQRPEIERADWCPMCTAVARVTEGEQGEGLEYRKSDRSIAAERDLHLSDWPVTEGGQT